jgi:hypothetical protein
MSNSARQTAPHEVPQGTRLVLHSCLPASLRGTADHRVASTQRYISDADWQAAETGALITTPWAVVDAAGATVARRWAA